MSKLLSASEKSSRVELPFDKNFNRRLSTNYVYMNFKLKGLRKAEVQKNFQKRCHL